ncbi:Tm-1-like ATP-binding domain-containing protein [Rubritalea tangerina]|uniref:Tm-1-like ATP-binding domain-containing protein n=1 Tax=Rubritalea tangerina TaxID=430798 RepID=UPI0036091277
MDRQDRGECVVAMSEAAPHFVSKLVEDGKIDGIISLGGGGGTGSGYLSHASSPHGFPKVMVSTLASGNTAHYVGIKDIVMIPSIVDVAGLNRIISKKSSPKPQVPSAEWLSQSNQMTQMPNL